MGVGRQRAIYNTVATTTEFISGYKWTGYWRYYSDIDRSIGEQLTSFGEWGIGVTQWCSEWFSRPILD